MLMFRNNKMLKISKTSSSTLMNKFIDRIVRNVSSLGSVPSARVKSFDEIPGPLSLPLIGSSWRYYPLIGTTTFADEHNHVFDNYKKYGPIWKEKRGFGDETIVMLCDADDIAHLTRIEGPAPYRAQLQSYGKYLKESPHLNGQLGVVSLQHKAWRTFRMKVQPPLLKPQNTLLYLDAMNGVADDFINKRLIPRLDDQNESPSDFALELHKWALESVALVVLNRRLGGFDDNLSPDSDFQVIISCATMMFQLIHRMEVGAQLWKHFPTKNWRKFVQVVDTFSSVVAKHINLTMEQIKLNPTDPSRPAPILEQLLMNTDIGINGATIMSQESFMTGVDTTSHTLAFVLYELAKSPDKQEKLYKEVKRLLPQKNAPVTVEVVGELKYLKLCIKETLRLHPILAGLFRKILTDAEFSGYHVPKDTTIIGAMYVMSRLEKYFPEPLKFNPERWSRESKKPPPHNYATLPFGTRIEFWVVILKTIGIEMAF